MSEETAVEILESHVEQNYFGTDSWRVYWVVQTLPTKLLVTKMGYETFETDEGQEVETDKLVDLAEWDEGLTPLEISSKQRPDKDTVVQWLEDQGLSANYFISIEYVWIKAFGVVDTNSLVKEIVSDFTAGLPIKKKLEEVNSGSTVDEWIAEGFTTGIFDIDNAFHFMSQQELCEEFEYNYLEVFTGQERSDLEEGDIWDFFQERMSQGEYQWLVWTKFEGAILTVCGSPRGKLGYYHDDLRVYASLDDALHDYESMGFFIGTHSSQEKVVEYLIETVIKKPNAVVRWFRRWFS